MDSQGAPGSETGGMTSSPHGTTPTVYSSPTDDLLFERPPLRRHGPDGPRIAEVVERELLSSLFQPIVELSTRRVVGYEALSRGPQGMPIEPPNQLFAEAREAGLVAELDAVCRHRALAAAREAGLRPPLGLFLNVEPDAIGTLDFLEAWCRGGDLEPRPPVIVELTERALTARPAELLAAVGHLRRSGCGIAVDDVGVDRRSLALMPFLRPDVIKLDLRLVQSRPSPEIAGVVTAVSAEAERSGATVLAEGIETEEQLLTALAMGAELGQGWLFGRPGPLPSPVPVTGRGLHLCHASDAEDYGSTPFELVAASRTIRRSSKRLMLKISRQLEAQALGAGEATVVLTTFQDSRHFTLATAGRYEQLARTTAFVGVLGADLASTPIAGVRGATLDHDERLAKEWNLVVLGPYLAAALVARDLGDEGPGLDRRFDYALTYDRELVVRLATSLMHRVAPTGEAPTVRAAVG